jgi:hypothetical protein
MVTYEELAALKAVNAVSAKAAHMLLVSARGAAQVLTQHGVDQRLVRQLAPADAAAVAPDLPPAPTRAALACPPPFAVRARDLR